MIRVKPELILIILLIPIIAYVGWQAYNTYLKPLDIEELEKVETEEPTKPSPPVNPPSSMEPKGVLDYTGFAKRDPLKPSLPVKEKVEIPPEGRPTVEKPEGKVEKAPPKEIVLPTFTVTGIVWGEAPPRAIIDNRVYKIGDTVKGAKILDITDKGVHMIYEGKEFFATIEK